MFQAGDQPSTTMQQSSSTGRGAGPGWIIFSVLAALGLVDSVAVLATNNLGLPIGFGWNKLIFVSFKGLALAANPSSAIYFTLASFAAQLGVIALFVLFAYLARQRSIRGYITGIVIYAFDALPALFNKDFATAGIHFLGLIGLFAGLSMIRNDGLTDMSGHAGKRLRWWTGWAVGCGGLLITTIALTAIGVFAGIVAVDARTYYADIEQRILQRAPADLSEAEREQLHQAMTELAELESLGHVNTAIDSDIRNALSVAAAGDRVERKDILRVIQVVAEASERAGRAKSETTDNPDR